MSNTKHTPDHAGSSKKKILWALVLVVLIACLGAGSWWFLSSSQQPEITVNLFNDCTPAYSGVTGKGKATLACKPAVVTEGAENSEELTEFLSSVKYKLTNGMQNELKNSQLITWSAQYNEQQAEKLNLVLENPEETFTVSGLKTNYESWADFTKADRAALDDLASRVLISNMTDSYGQKIRIEDASLTAKYLITDTAAGRIDDTVYYLIKTTFTREVWWLFGTSTIAGADYYLVTIPGVSPDKTIDTTLEGSEAEIEPLPSRITTNRQAEKWFLAQHPDAIDIME